MQEICATFMGVGRVATKWMPNYKIFVAERQTDGRCHMNQKSDLADLLAHFSAIQAYILKSYVLIKSQNDPTH